jgi:polyphosphate kinase
MEKKEDENGKLKRKQYEKEMDRLQVELCKLPPWVKYKGLRAIIVFEGRDAAGKGGTIRAITLRGHSNPANEGHLKTGQR